MNIHEVITHLQTFLICSSSRYEKGNNMEKNFDKNTVKSISSFSRPWVTEQKPLLGSEQ